MDEEFYTYLSILSHTLMPDKMDSILSMKCDESHRIGDLRKPTIIREKENAWVIKSRLPKNMQLQEHVKDLLGRISSIKDNIKIIATNRDVEIYFVCVIFTRQRPSIFFTHEQIAAIGDINAQLDIDLYILPERKEM